MDVTADQREWAAPAAYLVADDANVTDDAFNHAANQPDRATFARKVGEAWQTVTVAEFADQVRAVAAGLIAGREPPGGPRAAGSATAAWSPGPATWYADQEGPARRAYRRGMVVPYRAPAYG